MPYVNNLYAEYLLCARREANIKMIYIWNALWSTIYISHTWVECVITESAVTAQIYWHFPFAKAMSAAFSYACLLFLLLPSPNNYIQLTHTRTHRSIYRQQQNHWQLITWKMSEKENEKTGTRSPHIRAPTRTFWERHNWLVLIIRTTCKRTKPILIADLASFHLFAAGWCFHQSIEKKTTEF